MPELDADLLLEQASLLGLITSNQAFEAKAEAEDGSPDAVSADLAPQGVAHELADRSAQEGRPHRFLLRRLQGALPPGRGDLRRVYRGERRPGAPPVAIKVLRQRFAADPEAVDGSTRKPRPA